MCLSGSFHPFRFAHGVVRIACCSNIDSLSTMSAISAEGFDW